MYDEENKMEHQVLHPRKDILGILCLVITSMILVVGLWPFNFWPKNKVEWLKGENGVHFYGQGIIFSKQIISNPKRPLFLERPISIEIWFQPDSEPHSGLPRIFSLYDGKESEMYFLAQWKSTLILRTKTLQPNARWFYTGGGVGNALPKGQRRFITITVEEKGTSIYIDGRLEQVLPYYSFVPKNAATINQIVLGNSPEGKNYWVGIIYGFAIYNRSLPAERVFRNFQIWTNGNLLSPLQEDNPMAFYSFTERYGTNIHDQINHFTLSLPSKFDVPQKHILVTPWKDFRLTFSYFKDIILNILGFIPFGFLFSAYLHNKKIIFCRKLPIIVLLLGGSLSLSIEILQVYLPSRSSQLMDFFSNFSGIALGLVLFNFYHLGGRPLK